MKRGSIYWVNFHPTKPPEFGKTRPALIVSNSDQNMRLPTVVVIPLSTQPPEIWPLRLELEMRESKRGKKSYAVIPGIRQVSKERLDEMIDLIPNSLLDPLDEAIFAYLKD